MKILVTSDWHMDTVTAGIPRLNDIENFMKLLLDVIEKEEVDLLLHLGDFFNPGTMLVPVYTAKLMEFIQKLYYKDEVDVILIAGNHDVIEDSRGYTTISPLNFINRIGGSCDIVERPSLICINADIAVNFLCLPYVAKSAYDPSDLDNVIKYIEKLSYSSLKLIVAGHMTVPGAMMGSESKEMSRGRESVFPIDKIKALNPDMILNGHYHKAQVVNPSGVIIPGSPVRFNFGEKDDNEKGYILINV
jgi:DNA repair exonuclease SbcCD nuclease subunit